MNKIEIIEIFKDWNFWEKPWEEGISRPFYLEKMAKYVNSGQVLLITGARRSGKSFLMKQLASRIVKNGEKKKNILFINFEDPRWIGLDTKLLDKILETYREFLQPDERPYIFFDEIQEVAGWEKWIRTAHELQKATLIISGSNAKLLSRELGTVLTGRHLDITVYPLSFQEFLDFKKEKYSLSQISSSEIRGYLREYFKKGSFPALAFLEDGKQEWFLAYYDDVVEKDLIKRFKIRKTEELKALLGFYMGNIAKPATFNSAAKFLKISPDTAEKFASYFSQVYLIFFLKRHAFGIKEQGKSPQKIYSIDIGLADAIGFRNSDDFGRLAENIVCLEYLRGRINQPEREIFYWRDEQGGKGGKEIDFVVKSGNRILEIAQVSMGNMEGDTKKRELQAIAKAAKKLKPEKIYMITGEYEGIEKHPYGEVQFIPLWKWLLKK